jgi:MarR family transcriptional regulator, lower aerobic nicotinate degradation pathway regulator
LPSGNDPFEYGYCAVVYRCRIVARAGSSASSYRTSALLDHLARATRARAESELARHGLRPRHLVALTLLRDHGGFSQQGLATALQMDKTNLVGLLNDLENSGLAARRRSPEDRRRHIVEITPAGADRLGEAEDGLVAVEDHVLAGLDEDERETLYGLLQRATSRHVLDCAGASRDWAAGTPPPG